MGDYAAIFIRIFLAQIKFRREHPLVYRIDYTHGLQGYK